MTQLNDKLMTGPSRSFMVVSLLLLVLALSSPVAGAQDEDPAFDPYPLRPADTSSPRDTLRSYLTNMDELLQAWRQRTVNEKVTRAFPACRGDPGPQHDPPQRLMGNYK